MRTFLGCSERDVPNYTPAFAFREEWLHCFGYEHTQSPEK